MEASWVDILIVIFLLSWVTSGFERGFFEGIVDLTGFILALLVGTLLYPTISRQLNKRLLVPRGLGNLGSFLLVLFLVRTAYFATVPSICPRIRRLLARYRFAQAEHLAGALPFLAAGALWLSIILGTLVWYPVSPYLKTEIMRAQGGRFLVDRASGMQPRVETLLGQATDETMGFLTRLEAPDQTGEVTRLSLPKDVKTGVDSESEWRMLSFVNEERRSTGLEPLKMDPLLRKVARAHSAEMIRLDYFAHDSPVTGTPFDRMRDAGVSYLFAGENLAYAQDVVVAHEGLMDSPSHRENILTAEFTHVGIGAVEAGPYGIMFAQEFTD